MSSEGGTAVIQRYFGGGDNEQRTALQFAFFNVLLFVLLGVSLCGIFALYNMMYMFLSPMLWAVLVGTVLFPFKKKVTDIGQNWLHSLQKTNQTLAKSVITLPFSGFSRISETVYKTFASPNGAVIAAAYTALKILSYERTFMYVISWIGRLYAYLDAFIVFFARPWVLPLIIVYFCCYAAWIYVQDPKQINKKLARSFSLPIWIYVISYASLYFGPLRACVFGLSAAVLGLLSAGIIGGNHHRPAGEKLEDSPEKSNESTSILPPNVEKVLESAKEKLDATEQSILDSSILSTSSTVDEAISGDWLIRAVFGLCALLWIVRHDGALILLAIPFVIAVLRKVAEQLGITAAFYRFLDSMWTKIEPSVTKIVEITVAGPLREFVKMLFSSDKFIVESLHQKMDVLSSVIVMALLAFSALFALVFVGFQLHGETVHLVRLTSNVVSNRPDWLAAAMNYTEDQLEENDIDIDNYVQQAYEQGRAWLASNVRSLANGKDTKRADMLEEQVKQVVDKLYAMWEERNSNLSIAVNQEGQRGDVWQQLKGVTDLTALKDELTLIVKENLDTLMGVAQSIGSVLAVNVSFVSSLVAAFAGIILSFGMELLNTFIELIVFLTMVYYLLSASRNRWLPLQWASDLSAVTTQSPDDPTSSGDQHHITAAIEHAIFGVFVLSAKMAVFYGLYTYFVHSLFDLNIVFLPSMAASLFAAIPIMPPYIVAIFGIVELWLVRGEGAAALVFTLASFAPVMFADATFYKEVKGSHPYVTGLAIIGGMYWLGLQGAIIGPIILCLCLVLVNVYLQHVKPSALFTPSPSPRNVKLHDN